MWLDKVLLSIAEDHKLKASSDKVFGVINGQYICIFRSQQGYVITARISEESLNLFEAINQNQGICKAIGLKRGKADLSTKHLVITGVMGHLFPSKTKIKINETLYNLVELLNRNQKHESATTEDTILIEGIPSPNDENLKKSAEKNLVRDANKVINHHLGAYVGVLFGLGAGVILGMISWLMQKHAGSDINPFGKGLIASGISAGMYIKIAGGIDKKSRIIVALISVLIFLSWDISLLFFHYYFKANISLTLERLIQIYKTHFLNFSVIGKFALVALGTIAISSAFLVRGTVRKAIHVEDGEKLDGESLAKAKKLKKGEKLLGFIIAGGFVLCFATALISASVYDYIEYISLTPFIQFGFIVMAITVIVVNLILKRTEILRLSLLNQKDGAKEKTIYWLMIFLISASVPVSLCFVLSYINLAFDKSSTVTIQAKASTNFSPGKYKCNSLEFSSEKYGYFDHRVCQPLANLIEKDELVSAEVRKGFLNIPYILKLNFPNLVSMKTYLSTRRKEEDLRSDVVQYFYENDKSVYFKSLINKWETSCVETAGPRCRLRAYIYEIEKRDSESLDFLKKGCFFNDPVACRGLLSNNVASDFDKSAAKEELKKRCIGGDDSYCMERVWVLWNAGHEINRTEISKVLDMSCKRGHPKACEIQKIQGEI
jgi:hypothetical protein